MLLCRVCEKNLQDCFIVMPDDYIGKFCNKLLDNVFSIIQKFATKLKYSDLS